MPSALDILPAETRPRPEATPRETARNTPEDDSRFRETMDEVSRDADAPLPAEPAARESAAAPEKTDAAAPGDGEQAETSAVDPAGDEAAADNARPADAAPETDAAPAEAGQTPATAGDATVTANGAAGTQLAQAAAAQIAAAPSQAAASVAAAAGATPAAQAAIAPAQKLQQAPAQAAAGAALPADGDVIDTDTPLAGRGSLGDAFAAATARRTNGSGPAQANAAGQAPGQGGAQNSASGPAPQQQTQQGAAALTMLTPQTATAVQALNTPQSEILLPSALAAQAATPETGQTPIGQPGFATGQPVTTSGAVQTTGFAQQLSQTAQQPPAQQLGVSIARGVKDGVDRIDIQLHPAELGRVDVRMELGHDGRVIAVVSAEKPETLDQLRRDVQQLERALADAGFDTDRDSFTFQERDERPAFARNGDEGDGDPLMQDLPDAHIAAQSRTLVQGGIGIDISV
jgi:flagellar hook-length control protein FliK